MLGSVHKLRNLFFLRGGGGGVRGWMTDDGGRGGQGLPGVRGGAEG